MTSSRSKSLDLGPGWGGMNATGAWVHSPRVKMIPIYGITALWGIGTRT